MKLNQVTIPSLDVRGSVPFNQHLGLTLIVDALPHYVCFACPIGDATFSIHWVDSLAQVEGIFVYFEIENLNKKVNQLVSGGFGFDAMPTDKK